MLPMYSIQFGLQIACLKLDQVYPYFSMDFSYLMKLVPLSLTKLNFDSLSSLPGEIAYSSDLSPSLPPRLPAPLVRFSFVLRNVELSFSPLGCCVVSGRGSIRQQR